MTREPFRIKLGKRPLCYFVEEPPLKRVRAVEVGLLDSGHCLEAETIDKEIPEHARLIHKYAGLIHNLIREYRERLGKLCYWPAIRGDRPTVEAYLKAGADLRGSSGAIDRSVVELISKMNFSLRQKLLERSNPQKKHCDLSAPDCAKIMKELSTLCKGDTAFLKRLILLTDNWAVAEPLLKISSRQIAELLLWAAANGHAELVALLLAAGADRDAKDGDGLTAFHLAAEHGHRDIVDAFLLAGVPVNSAAGNYDYFKRTALFLAATNGHVEVAKLLLNKRASFTIATGVDGAMPLAIASQNGQIGIVKLLLDCGANPNEGGKGSASNNAMPLHMAAGKGHMEVIEELLSRGAQLSVRIMAGRFRETPLHLAVREGREDVVKRLLEVPDIDIDVGNINGLRPLDYADGKYSMEIEEANGKRFAEKREDGIRRPEIVRILEAAGGNRALNTTQRVSLK